MPELKTIDSRLIPAEDRREAIAEQGRKDVIPVDTDYGGNDPLVLGAVIDVGAMRLSRYYTNSIDVSRTSRRTEDDYPPSVMLGLQMRGQSLLIQDDREVALARGNLVVYRSDSPYTILDEEGYCNGQVLIPIADLALPHTLIRQITATSLCPGHPIAELAAAYFYRLVSDLPALEIAAGERMGAPSVELLRAVISTHIDAEGVDATESAHATLQLRILEYIRAHLGDPGLGAYQIAHEHHISVRQLYKVLSAADITLGDWIRAQRLKACRDQLSRPAAQRSSIAGIARQWGFTDPSSFARMFRTAYGLSPREWRDQSPFGSPAVDGVG